MTKLDSSANATLEFDELSTVEIFELIELIINEKSLSIKDKEEILKQLFIGKPLILEKILKTHPTFKEFYRPKTGAKPKPFLEESPINQHDKEPPTRLVERVDIKSSLQAQKKPTENNHDLLTGLKNCLRHEIKIDLKLIKSMMKLQNGIKVTTQEQKKETKIDEHKHGDEPSKTKEETLTSSLKKQAQLTHHREKLYTVLNTLLMQHLHQQTLLKQIEQAHDHQENLSEEAQKQKDIMTTLILDRIIEMIKAGQMSDAHESPVIELLGRLSIKNIHLPHENEDKFKDIVDAHTDNMSTEENEMLSDQDIPIEVRIAYLLLIADCLENTFSERPDAAQILLNILLNPKNISIESRNEEALKFCAFLCTQKFSIPTAFNSCNLFFKGP